MTEQMEQMIYNEGYRRGKVDEAKLWKSKVEAIQAEYKEVRQATYNEGYRRGNADRPKGEWIDNGDRYFRCSLCGTKDTDTWDWCHGCGCRMKGADDE